MIIKSDSRIFGSPTMATHFFQTKNQEAVKESGVGGVGKKKVLNTPLFFEYWREQYPIGGALMHV